jgi:hypothetical protein
MQCWGSLVTIFNVSTIQPRTTLQVVQQVSAWSNFLTEASSFHLGLLSASSGKHTLLFKVWSKMRRMFVSCLRWPCPMPTEQQRNLSSLLSNLFLKSQFRTVAGYQGLPIVPGPLVCNIGDCLHCCTKVLLQFGPIHGQDQWEGQERLFASERWN